MSTTAAVDRAGGDGGQCVGMDLAAVVDRQGRGGTRGLAEIAERAAVADALATNYCAGFLRQQENPFLGIPRAVAAGFPPKLQALLGYDLFGGLIGHVDEQHPGALLGGPVQEKPVIFDPRARVWRRDA
jgi:hypothetical protein